MYGLELPEGQLEKLYALIERLDYEDRLALVNLLTQYNYLRGYVNGTLEMKSEIVQEDWET